MGTATKVSQQQITEMVQEVKELQRTFKGIFGDDWQSYMSKAATHDDPKTYLGQQLASRTTSNR